MSENTIVKTKNRLEVVDSLRGFAIMAIMLLHSIEHFNYYVFPSADSQPAWLTALDTHIWDTLFFLFGGKGYAIFALLFGFTFSLMYLKQKAQGIDFGYRFLWRMLLLAGFALFNGAFFPGEVLSMYAMLGLVLFLVRKQKPTTLLIIAFLFLLQPLDLGRFFYSLFDAEYVLPAKHSGQFWGVLKAGQMGDSFWNLIKTNTLNGHKVTFFWSYEVGRLVQSAGLFVLGYWLGLKNKFNDNPSSLLFWKRTLIIASVTFVPLYLLKENFNSISELQLHRRTLRVAIEMYSNVAFTFILVSSFWLLYRKAAFKRLVRGLRFPGRMSLTAYVLQSVIGSFIFFGYGLGLGPHVRHTVSLGIGIVIWIALFYFFKWWINKYGQGPLEKLWHKMTWVGVKH